MMKEQILEMAQQQMMDGGYENLNFANIADELSTTRANLHHHFKNKEGLATEATRAYVNQQYQLIQNLEENFPDDFEAYWGQLEELFYQEVVVNKNYRGCVCGQLVRESEAPPSLLSMARDHFNRIEASFARVISATQKKGKMRDDVPAERLAILAHSVLMGVAQMISIHSDNEEFLTNLKGLLSEGLKAHLKES